MGQAFLTANFRSQFITIIGFTWLHLIKYYHLASIIFVVVVGSYHAYYYQGTQFCNSISSHQPLSTRGSHHWAIYWCWFFSHQCIPMSSPVCSLWKPDGSRQMVVFIVNTTRSCPYCSTLQDVLSSLEQINEHDMQLLILWRYSFEYSAGRIKSSLSSSGKKKAAAHHCLASRLSLTILLSAILHSIEILIVLVYPIATYWTSKLITGTGEKDLLLPRCLLDILDNQQW